MNTPESREGNTSFPGIIGSIIKKHATSIIAIAIILRFLEILSTNFPPLFFR